MVGRMTAALALALILAGCASTPAPSLPPGAVYLLTWSPASSDATGCYTLPHQGGTSVDPTYGTELTVTSSVLASGTYVLAWPQGYTARRVGDEVQVLDDSGKVRAVTGQAIDTGRGSAGSFEAGEIHFSMPIPSGGVFQACG
jgi:hypothetical protein